MRQTLLQNATPILLHNSTKVYVKMRQLFCYKLRQFYYKLRKILSQNAAATLLQNTAKVCYKMCQLFWYKMRQLLQDTTILLQSTTIIEKYDLHYKMRQ